MKGMTILIVAWIVAAALSSPSIAPFAPSNARVADPKGGQEEPGPGLGTKGATKEARWHGEIVRSDKEKSSLTVRRRGHYERVIHYDSSTKWTMGTKMVDMSEVKDGDEVICLGKYNDKKEFIATRIDLRKRK